MQEYTSGQWRVWMGSNQEVLDLISQNEASLESIRFYPNASQGDFLCSIVRFKDN